MSKTADSSRDRISCPPAAQVGRGVALSLLLIGLAVAAVVSLGIGRVFVAPDKVAAILASRLLPIEPSWERVAATIVLDVRLPRILAAIVVGAALAAAGAAYQNLFRNPIVAPDILGVSAGAGLGASTAIMLHLGTVATQGLAFAGGLTAVALCFSVGQAINRHSLIVLILVGVVVAAFFQSLISILKILADPVDVLPVITFWLLGGLNAVTMQNLPVPTALIGIGLAVLYAVRWQVNVMSLGAEEARALGIDTVRIRLLLVVAATLMTAAAVSLAGIIGWVGLVVPHMGRMLVGPSFDRLLPVTMALGGLFLLAVDDVSRSASSMELPLGITTSVVGAPLFLVLLLKARTTWT